MQTNALAPVSALGYVELSAREPAKLVEHYVGGLGLKIDATESGRTYLSAASGGNCILVTPGDRDGRASVGFELGCEFSEAVSRLRAADMRVETRVDPHPDVTASVVIAGHDGAPLELCERSVQRGRREGPGVPTRIGHIATFTTDIEATQTLYEDVLGFKWADTVTKAGVGDYFLFMRCGPEHHTANFVLEPEISGMHHLAFGSTT